MILFMQFMRTVACYVLILLSLWSCSPISKYESDPDVLGWEKDIAELEHRDSLESDPPEAILFTGSSSIRLWSSIEDDMKPYSIISRGYGGAKLSDFAVYCPRIIYPHQFKAMVLFVANDIGGGEKDKTPEEVLDLFKYIVKQVRVRYKDEPIFFVQITPTNSRWKVWNKISEANNLIKDYCSHENNLHFIETAKHFIGPDEKPRSDLFNSDQLHLNDQGYKLWASVIKENLDKVLTK
jgi:hypothetical protein